jgi:transposase
VDPEKKSLIASERDEAARAAWRARAAPIDPARFVWVDETGSHIALTPTHARAPRGVRARGRVPRNRGRVTTTIAALTVDGMGPTLLLEGGVDTDAFVAYITGLLAPTLRPDQIVVLDNLAAHHAARVRVAIEGRGAEVWFLPPYSPDLNPIEEAFSKLKSLLRRAGARSRDALTDAIRAALRIITPADASGWYAHCGYPSPDQLQ